MAIARLLTPDFIAMIARGVSTIVASRDAALRPSIMRAVGCDITEDGHEVTVFVARAQSRQLVQDIASTGHVSVVFSEPASHRTVQVKANAARIRSGGPADAPVLARYLASMEHELAQVGIGVPLVHAMLAHRVDDLVAISFKPEQAFDQTPGPQAGAALGSLGP